jgi:hypothetical protein
MSKPARIYPAYHGLEKSFAAEKPGFEIEPTQQTEIAGAVSREIEFAVLTDGRTLDLIRSGRQPSGLQFLVWQNGRISAASHVKHGGEVLVVPKLDPTVVAALGLPATARPCPDIWELFMQINDQIEHFVEITPESSFLVTAFILTTWFADRLSVVPYLSICGPPESGKTRLMRLLHCLCRRAIHTSAITPASLYRLVPQVRPTLLIDETEFGKDLASRNLQRLLRGGNSRGSQVLCNGKAYENFGPKAIASRVPLDDAALVSRNINVVMTPSDRDFPSLDLEAEQELADTVHPMLEMFRLLHYERVFASSHPGFMKFPPRLRDNARAFGAAMLQNEDLQQRLAAALQSQTFSIQFDRFNEPEWAVMLALYSLYHFPSGDGYVHAVTEAVNRIHRENGETRLSSPKTVGRILNKSLGFPTHRRGEGYRVELSGAGRKIHQQAKAMGITHSDILSRQASNPAL